MKLGDKIDKWEVVGIGSNHVLLRDGEEHLSVSKTEAERMKAPVKKKLHEASRDGDGDGFINDGKPNERRVAKKKAPVKKKVTKKKANVRKTKKKD